MRIGIEAQRIFRAKKHGMDIYALQLIQHLMKVDHENEYFIFVKDGPDVCLKPTENFHIVTVPGATYLDWEQCWLPLAAAQKKLDILHCTSNTAPILTSIPLILTLHDIIYLNKSFQGGSLYQRMGHYYRKWIVPMVYHKAKRIITVSNYEKGTIEERLGKDERLMVTYNGVHDKFNNSVSDQVQQAIRAKYSLPDNYLFFLGNTAPKKNMKNMLISYARYVAKTGKALPLVVAESSQEEIDELLQAHALTHIRHKVLLTGYVNHDDLPVIYHMAKLFIYPSLRESFGIPIIEAMACGTAVVTSNTSSMPEVAAGAAHLIDPEDCNDMADAIYQLSTDYGIRGAYERKGLKRAANFSWSSTADNTKLLYAGGLRAWV